MIIDLILDRKDNKEYNSKKFYNNVMQYGKIGWNISEALDNGNEDDIKKALCEYIINNEYNINICKYINSINWLI